MKWLFSNCKFYFGILGIMIVLASCDKDDDTPAVALQTLDQLITAKPELSIFNAALVKTRLTTFTQGGGPYTIWAPSNAAFNAIGINSAADLAMIDSNLLVQILTYHIQTGARSYPEIPLGPNSPMVTQGGFTQYASRYDGGFAYVNGAKVSGINMPGSNGYLYIIDRVLTPPYNAIRTNLQLNTNYKQMLQAIVKTNADSAVGATYTLFAVPNSVMTAAGYDSVSIARVAGTTLVTLRSIMRYHMVQQRIFYPDFKAGNLKTFQGTNVVISLTPAVNIKGTSNPSPFQITIPDVLSTNGVIHAINGLLKP